MAYDEGLAQRLRESLPPHVTEKKMFGGLCFLDRGNMVCGVVGDTLMVRLGEAMAAEHLQAPHARPMDFTGKPLKSMLYVDGDGVADDADLHAWVERALAFSQGLPAK